MYGIAKRVSLVGAAGSALVEPLMHWVQPAGPLMPPSAVFKKQQPPAKA